MIYDLSTTRSLHLTPFPIHKTNTGDISKKIYNYWRFLSYLANNARDKGAIQVKIQKKSGRERPD